MKYIILVGDGIGDLPIDELNGMTPLEYARTPAMDFVASHGVLGQLQTVPPGFHPGSDVANLSLLGYKPEDVYTGRSPLEAASLGVDLLDNEIAFRCNLVTVTQNGGMVTMVDYSGGHIDTGDARQLIAAINKEITSDLFTLYPGISYRHLFVYRGNVAGLVTVPPHDYTGQDVTQFWKSYAQYPDLKQFVRKASEILQVHPLNRSRQQQGKLPANGVWLWGEGKAPSMTTLEQNFGVSGALISAVDLLKGIGVYAGMEVVNVPGATGYLDTDYQGKVDAALSALDRHDLVLVHVEAPDETGHQGLLKEKIQAIEDFDQKVVQKILDGMKQGQDFRLVICMDHFTPISMKTHIAVPVPFALFDSRSPEQKNTLSYSEKNGKSSSLHLANGEDFFQFLLTGNIPNK
ncbi:MAG: cofactor-independent phosphoglycerate mutase [Proteobacteria bacterium]|nr:cofactor-independent phosphoglycerate mutase [Pseudomonadota bacterium]MBU4298263.1 cofactor-independent phosphoglycerate mutase [Pseudomonadota bacterium]MCG2747531.1 cofactor-independent phosphoglycerate mutase [Desulfobulbaceae bacterium]